MALKPKSSVLDDILFVVVTCSRDRWRDKAARRLFASLNRENRRLNFAANVLVFDNDSTLTDAFSSLEFEPLFAVSAVNIGYWSALKWSLENSPRLFGREFPFVHPVESDLVFYKMERLSTAARYLQETPTVHCVRTQEFEVARKERFFKGTNRFLRIRRSQVADYNGATGEKVSFKAVPGQNGMFLTNWHAKVPALHRYQVLLDVLTKMSALGTITEGTFMQLAAASSPSVGLIDGGVFYGDKPSRRLTMGSYTPSTKLQELGYRQTRTDTMVEPTGRISEYRGNPWAKPIHPSVQDSYR